MWWMLACAHSPATPPDTEASDTSNDDTATDEAPVRWNVAVFMNGDNDLESYVVHDLNELERAAAPGVKIWVQADRIPGYADEDGDWTGTRRYQIEKDEDTSVVSSRYEEIDEADMGSPEVLADFLAWVDAHPAEHTLLALWDHGSGWDARLRSEAISDDATSGSMISIAGGGLRAALAPRVAERGKLDVIAFDACNMASWEVADSLVDHAEVMVASPSWVGGEGIRYAKAIGFLRDQPDASASDLGDRIAADMVEGGERTASAVDLAAIPALTQAIDDLAGAALSSPPTLHALDLARHHAESNETTWKLWYLDLRDYGETLAPTPLADYGQSVADAVDAAVIGAYGNEKFAFSGGLNLFAATNDPDALALYSDGDGATWSRSTRWDDALRTLATP
jgi:hypothetical protein